MAPMAHPLFHQEYWGSCHGSKAARA